MNTRSVNSEVNAAAFASVNAEPSGIARCYLLPALVVDNLV